MKKVILILAIIFGISTIPMIAQEVNLNKFVTLTVTNGQQIKLNFKAAAPNTPVRIISGNTVENITVGIDWFRKDPTDYFTMLSDGNTMTIYGDINEFDCSNNLEALTEIDLSNNKQLITLIVDNNSISSLDISSIPELIYLSCSLNQLTTLNLTKNSNLTTLNCGVNKLTELDISSNENLNYLNCYKNPFTTDAINRLYCSLHDRSDSEEGFCSPLYEDNDVNHTEIVGATSDIARNKNWRVAYYNTKVDIPSNGNFKCKANKLNLDKYITISVRPGKAINLGVSCSKDEMPIRIVNGEDTLDYIRDRSYAPDNPEHKYSIKPKSDKIIIYGDIDYLDCSNNEKYVADIDFSNNKSLKYIYCYDNDLSKLDLSNLKELEILHCENNDLESINLKNCISLQSLYCHDNKLYSLDLFASKKMEFIYCYNNHLSELDLSENPELRKVECYGNPFTTATMNDLYCSLPIVDKKKNITIYPLNYDKDANHAEILAASSKNATSKGWNVKYKNSQKDIANSGDYICPLPLVNDNRVITLSVHSKEAIKMDFKSAKGLTAIRIESGNKKQELIIGRNWYSANHENFTFTPEGDTINIYGDVMSFNCSDNEKNLNNIILRRSSELEELYCDNNDITTLDLSYCTLLTKLSCNNNKISKLDLSNSYEIRYLSFYNNPFTTDEVNEVYCSLPFAEGKQGVCYALNTDFDSTRYAVSAACSDNARKKNWIVKFYNNGDFQKDIPNNGQYTCPYAELDTTKFVTLNVIEGEEIKLDFKANKNRVPVRVVSGKTDKTIIIGTNWYDGDADTKLALTAGSNTMTIYGDIIGFSSTNNAGKLTGIDLSNNNQITELLLNGNGLTTLDVSKNTMLKALWCSDNNLTKLELDSNTNLEVLVCANNKLSSVDVSKNTALVEFSCANNKIEAIDLSNNLELTRFNCSKNAVTSLDFSKNSKLESVSCAFNKLSSLDFRHNEKLRFLACYNNLLNTDETNLLYCSLPIVDGKKGSCYILNETSYSYNIAEIETATAKNAVDKNWKVMYWHSGADVTNNGNYNCGSGLEENSNISVFPNPARGKVQVTLDEEVNEILILVDLSGRALLTSNVVSGRATIDVGKLTAGTYLICVGNYVHKLTIK